MSSYEMMVSICLWFMCRHEHACMLFVALELKCLLHSDGMMLEVINLNFKTHVFYHDIYDDESI